MAANGISVVVQEVEAGKVAAPLVPIEILEDPWTPVAEVERIAAEVARQGRGGRGSGQRPA